MRMVFLMPIGWRHELFSGGLNYALPESFLSPTALGIQGSCLLKYLLFVSFRPNL